MGRFIKIELQTGTFYKEHELIEIGLLPIEASQMEYLIYEYGPRIYFFEKTDNLLFLFCKLSTKSFFLS